jgi:hypothetical protein
LQIKPITAAGSVHKWSNGSQPSAAPMYRANVHIVAKPQTLSLLSLAILSLSSDLSFPVVWSLLTTTERLLASYKAKPRPFSAFSPPHLAGKRPQFRRPPEASNWRFSLISHQRSSKPPSSESSPSDLP